MSHIGFVAMAAGAALVLSGTPAVAQPHAVAPPMVVSMGDSFISGEAGRWRGNGNTTTPGSRFGTDLAAFNCGSESWCAHDPKRVYGESYDNGCNRYERTDYRLVLQSYPSPLPRGADNRYPESGWSRWFSGGCPFYNADSDWAHDTIVPSIADAHSRGAAQELVDFLDLRDALDGHEVCARGAEQAGATNTLDNPLPMERSEWVRWIGAPTVGQGQTQEFMHPNSYGQEVLASCLNAIASAGADELRCTGTDLPTS